MPCNETSAPLKADGKPMRALRALADTTPEQPLTEYGVWLVARRYPDEATAWHSPLATLVARGLAERCGRWGGYEWFITPAGVAALPGKDACERCGGCGWLADGPGLPQYDCPVCSGS